MFELSWGEIALIGIVALIVIGPKELPGLLRGLGQTLAKVRRMASDFQYQFNQALQEAEVDKVKSSIDSATDGLRSGASFNPIDYAREQIKTAVDGPKEAAAPAADMIGPPAPGAADPLPAGIPAPPSYTADPEAIQRSFSAPAPSAFAARPIEPPAGFASAVARPAPAEAPPTVTPVPEQPVPETPVPETPVHSTPPAVAPPLDIKPAEDAADAARPGKTPA